MVPARGKRHDATAAANIMAMLRRASPNDYARLKAQLIRQAGGSIKGLGQNDAQDSSPGFWSNLLDKGVDVLGTIADFKIQEKTAKAQQKQFQEAAAAEMERQALLAQQAKTQQMEFQAQMELQRQQDALEAAANKAKGRFNTAMYAVAGLLGLWLIARLAA